jgi:LCP family protein required for cell wall assembly
MVVHVDPVHRRAAVVSIPRDLWVPVDQTGAPQRISTALDGGAESLITTVKALLHIPINHYVEIDFDGFRRIIDAMGGVDIDFAAPTRDVLTGLEVEEAGCVHLDGDEALSLARSRHLQQLTGGRWEVDPTGDLGRITRQQALVLALFADLAATKNPATINRILDAAVDGVTMDDSLDASDLRDLGAEIRSLEPSDIALITLPTAAASIGGAAVLTADAASISGTVDQLLGRSQATLEPTSATPAAISGSC